MAFTVVLLPFNPVSNWEPVISCHNSPPLSGRVPNPFYDTHFQASRALSSALRSGLSGSLSLSDVSNNGARPTTPLPSITPGQVDSGRPLCCPVLLFRWTPSSVEWHSGTQLPLSPPSNVYTVVSDNHWPSSLESMITLVVTEHWCKKTIHEPPSLSPPTLELICQLGL